MSKDQIGAALEAPIPDVIAPIVGYRMWKWDQHGLVSHNGTRWKPGEVLEAKCVRTWTQQMFGLRTAFGYYDYKAPVVCDNPPSAPTDTPLHGEYGCGIYAYATIEDAWYNLSATDANHAVIGEVHLWGNVWPHEKGYRGQYAQPVALYRPVEGEVQTIWGNPIERLAEFYEVDLRDLPLSLEGRKEIEERQAEDYKRAMEEYEAQVRRWTNEMLYGSGRLGDDDDEKDDDINLWKPPRKQRRNWFRGGLLRGN